jgi:hypothetical protein
MTAHINITFALPILITSAQHQELQTAMLEAGQHNWQVNRMVNRPPKWKPRASRRHKSRSTLLACEIL